MLLSRFNVQPTEDRQFVVDYSDRLGSTQLLSTLAAVIVTPIDTPPFTVTGLVSNAGTAVTLRVTGGIDGAEYKVELQVTTTVTLETWEDELIFIVEDL